MIQENDFDYEKIISKIYFEKGVPEIRKNSEEENYAGLRKVKENKGYQKAKPEHSNKINLFGEL